MLRVSNLCAAALILVMGSRTVTAAFLPAVSSDDLIFSSLSPAEDGDPNIPDLIYDPSTGEVILDPNASTIIGYSLKSSTNSFVEANHLSILGGLITSLPFELSETGLSPISVPASVGFVLPPGLNLASLNSLLSEKEVSRSLGSPLVQFDLVVIGAVPEPSTYAMAIVGLCALGLHGWRRRLGAG